VGAITSIGPYNPQFHPDVGEYMAGHRNPAPSAVEVNCLRQFFGDLRVAAQSITGYRAADGATEVVSRCGHVVEFWDKGAIVRLIRRGTYP
jgi:hypothetical protein